MNVLVKRPVAFRVPRANDDGTTLSKTEWRYFADEAEAARESDALCTEYQGLYVRDGTGPVATSDQVATDCEFTEEDAANLQAHIWAAGADLETADFVAKQLLKKGLRLVPDRATEAMWRAGRSADEAPGDSYSKVYFAMIEAAPRA